MSFANRLVRQGEGVALPRLADVVDDAVQLLRDFGPGQVSFLGTDVALPPDEYRFAVVVRGGAHFYFRVLVFGAASAPTAWG
eukprot:12457888-Alexandrium_andersonii.AAC.1